MPYSLSHLINPIVREYRRASGTAIDASLKPLMQSHLPEIASGSAARRASAGELLAASSAGGVVPMSELIESPLWSVRSGPSLAPVAARAVAGAETGSGDVIVCDTGGTSFDVSLVRSGDLVFTSETWLGEPFCRAPHRPLLGRRALDRRRRRLDRVGRPRAACCASAPRAPAPIPDPPATGAAAPARPSPTRRSCSATSTPTRFLGGAMELDDAAARAGGRQLWRTRSGIDAPRGGPRGPARSPTSA